MTADAFRALALELPQAVEGAHMGHPDFRVGGKIFASLGPKEAFGVVGLPPDAQKLFVDSAPETFQPAAGAWGKSGWTKIELKSARKPAVRAALREAWRKRAPKELLDGEE
jgi:hypothetical protein